MNKKSKGTTLIEIMISILLISIIMVFLFNILVNIKEEYNLSTKRSGDTINRASYTRIIQNDLINLKLIGISNCSNGKLCIVFKFSDNIQKDLIINDKSIVYDNEIWELSSGQYDIDKSTFNYLVATTDPSELSQPNVINYYMLKIIVPVQNDVFSNKKFDFEITSVGKNYLNIDCESFKNYLESKGAGKNAYCVNQ